AELVRGALLPLTGDQYGYWILLTIVFVCQPRYAATLARLAERIIGTLLGLVVGWALLTLFPAPLAQAAFVVVAAVLFFALRATRYLLATVAITAFVLLSFNQVGDGFGLIIPRLLDTLAGSLIAGLSVWLILPSWHAQRLHALAADALRSQSRYLEAIMIQYGEAGKDDHLAYRIARRDAHNADAALSAALTAAYREPRYVRQQVEPATRFLVLSHTLLNYLSALGAHRDARIAPDDAVNAAAVRLGATLENLALMLGSEADDTESHLSDAASARPALADPPGDESDFHRVLRAQLTLSLDLLPALCAAAAELAPRSSRGGAVAT
ncbi:MAG: FUSC family protein, partial [Propionivibrio sp.]